MNLVAHNPPDMTRAESLVRVVAADVSLARDPLCRVVHAWLRTLRVAGTDEDELWRVLERRISCLAVLRQLVLDGDSKPVDDASLSFWLEGVDRAVAWWNLAELCDVESPVEEIRVDAPHPNAVLCTTVWETLADWTEPLAIPRAVRDAIESCVATSRRWCERIPVPPGGTRACDPRQYVHRSHGLVEILPALRSELESWDDLVLEDVADELLRLAGGRGTAQVAFNSARFSSARDLLLTVCRQLLVGWPFEIGRMETASRALSATTPNADSPLGSSFEHLQALLRSLDSALAGHRDVGLVQGPVATEPTLTSPALTEPLHPDGDCSTGLVNISTWINRAGADVMPTIRNELALLIEKARNGSDPSGQSKVGRDLLSLLVDIDSQLAAPIGSTRDLILLRDQLRRVLVDCFPYKILDATNLVGRTFDEMRDRVRVRYSQPGGFGGRIVYVQRPGYVFQFPDGRSTVIRPAEVDISA